MKRVSWRLSCLLVAIVSGSGCAFYTYHYREANYDERVEKGTVLQSLQLDPLLEDKILALDP
jgi:hypothetical protein